MLMFTQSEARLQRSDFDRRGRPLKSIKYTNGFACVFFAFTLKPSLETAAHLIAHSKKSQKS
jgi:hypothetical protein